MASYSQPKMELSGAVEEGAPEINKAAIVIGKVVNAIHDDNKKNVIKYLDGIPITKLTSRRQTALLDIFVGQMYTDGRVKIIDVVFDYFDKVHENITDLSTISLFLMRSGIPDNVLVFIGKSTQKHTFASIIQDITEYPLSPATREGCINARTMFGEQERHVYEELRAYVVLDPLAINNYVFDFIEENLDVSEPYKEKPYYIVGNVGGGISGFFVQETMVPPPFPDIVLPSPDDAANSMVKFLKSQKVDIQEKSEALAVFSSQYSISTLKQKLKMLAATFPKENQTDISNDEVLFKLYGPCNSLDDEEIGGEADNICSMYGGCRMFLCSCEDVAEEEEGDYDWYWFSGSCDFCRLKIKHPHYAVREPILYGGWSGCFCSLECVMTKIKDSGPLNRALLDRMQEQFETIGIADRRYKEKDERILEPVE